MNIEINFLDSFPSIEKLTKDNELYILIKNDKYNLKKLIESNQTIFLNNIENEILLKLLIKEKIILGINVFNANKFKELFLIDAKPIFQWLDFKQEKNNFKNKNNLNYFLYEYIRLKIKITPVSASTQVNLNSNSTYDEKINNVSMNNNTINNNKNSRTKFDKSFDINSKAITTKNDLFKKKILKKKNNKISLHLLPGGVKNGNFNSTRNISYFNKTTKNKNMNNSLSSKQNITSETYYTNRNYYNKGSKILKPLTKIDDYTNNYNKFNRKNKEELKLERNKLSLYGDELLLNEKDEFLYNKEYNKNLNKADSMRILKNDKYNTYNNYIQFDDKMKKYNEGINKTKIVLSKDNDNTNDNSNTFNISNNNSCQNEIDQFNILKNDFDLFYSQKFIKNIKDDVISFEFNLFLQKSISILSSYHNIALLLFFENNFIIKKLNHYRNNIKILKKKINKLSLLKEDIEFKLKNCQDLKESKSIYLEGIKSENNFQKKILQKVFITNKDKETMNAIINIIKPKIKLLKNENINLLKDTINEELLNGNINNQKITTIDSNDDKLNQLSTRNIKYKSINKDNLNQSYKSKKLNKTPSQDKKMKKIKHNHSYKINPNAKNINTKILNKNTNIKKNEKTILSKYKLTKYKTNNITPKEFRFKIQYKK